MKDRIYLDNNATTEIDPQVYNAVIAAEDAANPSSIHELRHQSRARLTRARGTIAEYFNIRPNEVIFTSSGTEAINMGVAWHI